MQKLTIERTNGNIPGVLPGKDHVSGLVFYSTLTDAELPSGFSNSARIKPCSSIESAEALGITADSEKWDIKVLYYTLSQIFAANPKIILYVGIFKSAGRSFAEIKQMQNYAGGAIRQFGVWDGHTDFLGGKSGDEAKGAATTLLNSIKSVAKTLEQQDKPCSILYAPKITKVSELPTDLAATGLERVSVVIAQDGAGTAYDLYNDAKDNDKKSSVTAIGDALGALSLAKVHQSIAWVEQFPTNIATAAFSDGTELNTLDTAVVETLDEGRYIFGVTYDGIGGVFFNDNHTMDLATSDYANIDRVRTMDKAVRGVRTYLLPKLGRPLLVDATSGQLDRSVKEYLETQANIPLEEMAKAGELSGYKAEIDPDQNVLQTSTVEIVIKNVPMGVNRRMNVKIGFTTSV